MWKQFAPVQLDPNQIDPNLIDWSESNPDQVSSVNAA